MSGINWFRVLMWLLIVTSTISYYLNNGGILLSLLNGLGVWSMFIVGQFVMLKDMDLGDFDEDRWW